MNPHPLEKTKEPTTLDTLKQEAREKLARYMLVDRDGYDTLDTLIDHTATTLLEEIVGRVEGKIQKDLDEGVFGKICSNESTFKQYVFTIIKDVLKKEI